VGLFDKLKQMVGVSGIKVNLILPKNSYQQGETISGVVKITGGPEAKLANALSVTLVEAYPEIAVRTHQAAPATPPAGTTPPQPSAPSASPQEIKTETLEPHTAAQQPVLLAQQLQIPAHAALEYPVSLQLPAQAAVNGPCQEWHVKTELDIAGSFDAADTDRITVTPHHSMLAARESICKGAGFPTTCVLRIEAVAASGERLSKRVYYL